MRPVDTRTRFIPALRFSALTPAFDPLVRITTRERTFKRALLDRAAVAPGESVLDVGAGTGTLALMLKERVPGAAVTGLDADPEILAQARAKAAAAGAEVEFVEGSGTALPFADASFDVVLSSLFFHHLSDADKRVAASEAARVLRPGGRLHVADWGRPTGPVMAALFLPARMVDGFDVTAANVRGELPAIFAAAGLASAALDGELRTPSGTLALYGAVKHPA